MNKNRVFSYSVGATLLVMFGYLAWAFNGGLHIPTSTLDRKPPPQVVVTVDNGGKYYLDREEVTPVGLAPAMQGRLDAKADTVFIINVDKQRPTQDIITVMDAVNTVKIPGHPNDPVGFMITTKAVSQNGPPAATPSP